ncbi:hypothetical protein [Amycolatopsis sp. TNS106]|uniref:hypothetical protein n=1 Tax=Amycolatopsis sp. TNS106 TaxID=2861750 RepID=UPI001C57BCE5|nr:hypothetical protein [Amycolatopsis sp. TNS106]QXV63565.1 hypothetical protein CVV72_41120 [Amycolatopsis sp. TNS106]
MAAPLLEHPRSQDATGELAAIIWQLEAYAGHWLPLDELSAVTSWMEDNRLVRATAQHPVVVVAGWITYGKDLSDAIVRAPQREIVTTTVPLRSAPPVVTRPACSPEAMAALQQAFRDHEWSAGFGGVCVDCSDTTLGDDGQIRCHRDNVVAWPCGPVRDAFALAGLPIPNDAGRQPRLALGDFLDPAVHAEAHFS